MLLHSGVTYQPFDLALLHCCRQCWRVVRLRLPRCTSGWSAPPSTRCPRATRMKWPNSATSPSSRCTPCRCINTTPAVDTSCLLSNVLGVRLCHHSCPAQPLPPTCRGVHSDELLLCLIFPTTYTPCCQASHNERLRHWVQKPHPNCSNKRWPQTFQACEAKLASISSH